MAEIISNARRDRKRLEAVADGLLEGSRASADPDSPEGEINTEVAAAFAEEIAKISDSLTRTNQQLVELLKADRKSAAAAPTRLDSADVEDALDQIQPEEQPN